MTGRQSESLRVRIGAETGVQVAPDLWGLFFEDINNCLDGGLNAELVRNGDFEFTERDHPGWGALTAWDTAPEGAVSVRHEAPVHPKNSSYIRIAGPAVLTNEGWGEIPVVHGQGYALSLATWRVFGVGSLGAQLVDQADRILADTRVEIPERGWSWVRERLTATASGRARFRIIVPAGLTVEIDVVSLRPTDRSGKPLTFRPDLLASLADLSPSFVRFPGGCVAHGLGLANMYSWKQTIGPRHEREQISNLWGYHQSRQIGYLEFFELCEAIGATPLPVLAAGVCCQNTRGGPQAIPDMEMPAYVQDVLDLVEFANGDPVSTQWGRIRADLGHPAPFGMRYLGVGNEDSITDEFRSRYARVEDAVHAAHPDITVVGTVGPAPFGRDFDAGWDFARSRGIAIVDEHAYRTPRWFHQNVDRYTDYGRGGTGVYFGEYAARTNTVRSALAEAAYMIGMERNSDVVRLASYAPLLARVGDTQWEPDLIYFDSDSVMLTANYFVQQLFSTQRGVHLHVIDLDGVILEPVTIPTRGELSFRSPDATFSITNLTVDGHLLPDVYTDPAGGLTSAGDIDPTASSFSYTATRTAGTKGLATRFGGTGDDSFLELVAPNWTGLESVVNRYDDGISNDDHGPVPWRSLTTGEPIEVRISLKQERVRVWVDDVLLHDYSQDLRPEHRVIAAAAARPGLDGSGEFVLRLVNATASERPTQIEHMGLPCAGTARLLAGRDPDAGSFQAASPVTPEQIMIGEDGLITLPPWSLLVAVVRPRPEISDWSKDGLDANDVTL